MLSSLLFYILIILSNDQTQRIFIVAKVIKSAFAAFITGKVETLGSTFSNETPIGGCLRPHATIDKSIKY